MSKTFTQIILLITILSCTSFRAPYVFTDDFNHNRKVVRSILKDNLPHFKTCYERELKKGNYKTGVVRYRFNILPNGKTARAKVRSAISRRINRCILSRIKRMDFPKTKSRMQMLVRQELSFNVRKTFFSGRSRFSAISFKLSGSAELLSRLRIGLSSFPKTITFS